MRIERVEVITLRVPWGPDDWGEFRDWPVVRIHADDGRVGMGRGGDARLIRAEFEELLVGQDPARISLHWQRMFDRAWRFRGPGPGCHDVDLRHRRGACGTSWARRRACRCGGCWADTPTPYRSTQTALDMKTRTKTGWPRRWPCTPILASATSRFICRGRTPTKTLKRCGGRERRWDRTRNCCSTPSATGTARTAARVVTADARLRPLLGRGARADGR